MTLGENMPCLAPHSDLTFQDLLPGDVLLHKSRSPTNYHKFISNYKSSPYTHAAIYLGNGMIAEVASQIRESKLSHAVSTSCYIGVVRSPLGFNGRRPIVLRHFIKYLLGGRTGFYFLLFSNNFMRNNALFTSKEIARICNKYKYSLIQEGYIRNCHSRAQLIAACFSAVGIISSGTMTKLYELKVYTPELLYSDPTFSWYLGHLIPKGGCIVSNKDPLKYGAVPQWANYPNCKWWP